MSLPVLGALALLFHAAGDPSADVSRPRLLVVVAHNERGADEIGMLNDALRGARDLWRPYVDISFAVQGAARGTSEADDLTLVMTNRLAANGDEVGLGWIEFSNGRPARTITVSTAAAERLMQATSWRGRPLPDLPRAMRRQFMVGALGRAIAHEIGHYLLKSPAHARHGLMRARMTADDIMLGRRRNAGLESDDLRRLDRRLLEYADALVAGRPPA